MGDQVVVHVWASRLECFGGGAQAQLDPEAIQLELPHGQKVTSSPALNVQLATQAFSVVSPWSFILLPGGFQGPCGENLPRESVEWDVTFPRTVNGKELFNVADGKLSLNFDPQEKRPAMNSVIDFDPRKMLFRGKLEY